MKNHDDYDDIETRLRIAELALARLHGWVEGAAFYTANPHSVVTVPSLQEIADDIRRTLTRVMDEDLCNHHCKWMYFCEEKNGHQGDHRESGLHWEQDDE